MRKLRNWDGPRASATSSSRARSAGRSSLWERGLPRCKARSGSLSIMNDEQSFLQAMRSVPKMRSQRLVFADWWRSTMIPAASSLRCCTFDPSGGTSATERNWRNGLRTLLAAGVAAGRPVHPRTPLAWKFAWIPAGTFLMGSPETENRQDR